MSCKKKISSIMILLSICCIALFIPFASVSANDNYAFSMEAGAQARVDFTSSETPDVENAIRFVSTIKKAAIDDNADAKVVTIITLTDYLEEAGLNSKKDFTLANLIDNEVKYQTVEFSKSIGNLVESGDNYVMNACLYNVKEANIAEEMSAVSYLDLGEGPVQYTEYTYKGEGQTGDHASSLWEIANAYKGDPDYASDSSKFEALSMEYTLTVQCFEDSSVTNNVTIRRGESLEDIKDKVNAVVAVDGVAYFNCTAQKDGQPYTPEYISSNETLEIGYNSLEFTLIEGLNDEETAHCGGKYSVSGGTLTPEDTLMVKVPSTFKGVDVVRLGGLGGKAFTHVILPESVGEIFGSFNNMRELKYVSMPGVSKLDEYYHGSTSNRAGWNAFLNCDKLEYLILGNSFTTTGPHFGTNVSDASLGNMDVYMLNDGDTFSAGNNAVLYSENVYYSSDNASVCGTWCFGTDGITIVKNNNEHDFGFDGKCANCGVYDSKGVTYTFDTNHYIVSGYTGTATEIIIPAKYNNGKNGEHDVTAVAANAFENSTVKTTVVEVWLPKEVTSIGKRAFAGCSALTTVSMTGVSKIAGSQEVFNFCNNLTNIIVGAQFVVEQFNFRTTSTTNGINILVDGTSCDLSINSIQNQLIYDNNTVYYKSDKASVCGTWGYDTDGVTIIKNENDHDFGLDGKCANCGVYDAQGVTYTFDTDHYVVSGYTGSATEIVIPAKFNNGINGEYDVTTVAASAFENSASKTTITKVILPESVTTIGSRAFAGCSSLEHVSMIGVKELKSQNFVWTDKLTSIIIGTSLKVSDHIFTRNVDKELKVLVDGSSCNLSINSGTYAENNGYYNPIKSASVYYYNEDGVSQGTWKYTDSTKTDVAIVENN